MFLACFRLDLKLKLAKIDDWNWVALQFIARKNAGKENYANKAKL